MYGSKYPARIYPYWKDRKCELCGKNVCNSVFEFEISWFRGEDICVGVCKDCEHKIEQIKKFAKSKIEKD